MKPLDRVLCITAALFGIICLIAGLTTASLVTWRGHWQ
jgi:hypothetical protein